MKVLGKVWNNLYGNSLTIKFYIKAGENDWWKTNEVVVIKSHKRFNLRLIFSIYSLHIESKFAHFKIIRQEKPMWEKEFEVDDETIKEKFMMQLRA